MFAAVSRSNGEGNSLEREEGKKEQMAQLHDEFHS